MYENERPKSEFNMAVSYLNRLNGLLINCDEQAMNLQISKWFHTLLALKRELNSQMTKEEQTISNDYIKRLISLSNICDSRQEDGDNIPNNIYIQFHNFEEHLRDVLARSGLLTKFQDDASRALH